MKNLGVKHLGEWQNVSKHQLFEEMQKGFTHAMILEKELSLFASEALMDKVVKFLSTKNGVDDLDIPNGCGPYGELTERDLHYFCNMDIKPKSTKKCKAIYKQKIAFRQIVEEQNPIYSTKITMSRDAVDVARHYWDMEEIHGIEHFNCLFLNKGNMPICWAEISKGGVAGTVVDSRVVLVHGLNCLASGIILFHNHPSGNLKPSQADIELTRKLKEAGKYHDITVLDHVILAPDFSHYSFGDEGII